MASDVAASVCGVSIIFSLVLFFFLGTWLCSAVPAMIIVMPLVGIVASIGIVVVYVLRDGRTGEVDDEDDGSPRSSSSKSLESKFQAYEVPPDSREPAAVYGRPSAGSASSDWQARTDGRADGAQPASGQGPRMCSVGCGRPAAGSFPTCCKTCRDTDGSRHGPVCNAAQQEAFCTGCGTLKVNGACPNCGGRTSE